MEDVQRRLVRWVEPVFDPVWAAREAEGLPGGARAGGVREDSRSGVAEEGHDRGRRAARVLQRQQPPSSHPKEEARVVRPVEPVAPAQVWQRQVAERVLPRLEPTVGQHFVRVQVSRGALPASQDEFPRAPEEPVVVAEVRVFDKLPAVVNGKSLLQPVPKRKTCPPALPATLPGGVLGLDLLLDVRCRVR